MPSATTSPRVPSLSFPRGPSTDSHDGGDDPTVRDRHQSSKDLGWLGTDDNWLSDLSSLNICGSSSDTSDTSEASSVRYDIDFETVIEDMLSRGTWVALNPDRFETVYPVPEYPPIMIKRFPRSSSELLILLELNRPEYRRDPWNPAPRILSGMERDDDVFLCFEPLLQYNEPPLKTVADYIDFFTQSLEGLVFLHENNFTSSSYSEPSSFMIDLGTWSPENFDRARYPVRYYNINFSKAVRTNSRAHTLKDVQDCGTMIDQMLMAAPMVRSRLQELITVLKSGQPGAEEARKSLETACKSLEAAVFNMPVADP